jgi:hypothetical protein
MCGSRVLREDEIKLCDLHQAAGGLLKALMLTQAERDAARTSLKCRVEGPGMVRLQTLEPLKYCGKAMRGSGLDCKRVGPFGRYITTILDLKGIPAA